MTNPSSICALIYCRVSSERQKNEGHGLESQEHRCREYARDQGYEVEEVFRDSFSGGGDFMNRPAMVEMLRYVDNRPHKTYVVIFDDLKRFARDTEFHLKLRTALKVRNITPECLNYKFDDSPEGMFVETIFAAQGQLEREQNRRQVIQKMKVRLEKGYWCNSPPPGYTMTKTQEHGKLLTPLEPKASMIREAFEGFATDRFMTQADVWRYLLDAGFSKGLHQEGVRRLLRRCVYAGYVEREEWEVSRRKGHHEPIVSLETYEKVQAKLDGKSKVRVRKDDRIEFILRGFLLCAFCRLPMTASWSQGRNGRFRYYRCKTCTCVRYNKSIRADLIDDKFKVLLRNALPKPAAAQLAREIVLDLWEHKLKGATAHTDRLEKELREVKKNTEVLLDRIVRAVDEKVVAAYEAQITRNQREAETLQEKLRSLGNATVSFETAFGVVMEFLKNPVNIWETEDINAKRLVMRLVFAEKLAFHPDLGFETAEKPLLIGLFEQFTANDSQDVEITTRC